MGTIADRYRLPWHLENIEGPNGGPTVGVFDKHYQQVMMNQEFMVRIVECMNACEELQFPREQISGMKYSQNELLRQLDINKKLKGEK